ncbi:MAG: hypothetical protein ACRDUV_22570 [Pseudonocardiaceae bacterium]
MQSGTTGVRVVAAELPGRALQLPVDLDFPNVQVDECPAQRFTLAESASERDQPPRTVV